MHKKRIILLFALWLLSSCPLVYVIIFYKKVTSKIIHHDVIVQNLTSHHGINVLPSNSPSGISKILCPPGVLMYGQYCVLTPYENEQRNTSNVGLVTLCTQGTVEFLHHVIILCHRWSSPISVAVYSPLEDYASARLTVHMLRHCDLCVRYWVNWHFFFRNQEMPKLEKFPFNIDCSSITKNTRKPRRRRSQGTYPINVGRNIARNFTRTPYIFSIDIELYPSLDIPIKFENMLRLQPSSHGSEVWVFPVFEVHSKFHTPLSKPQLKKMFAKKQAISFHEYKCNVCHRIPNLTQWMKFEDKSKSEVEDALQPLKIWTTVKRNERFKLNFWEPFFIGTTKDPEFDIRLSWEGKQNKMQMAYEMCMRNYDFHIIENAFLVHSPGIDVYNATKEKARWKYARINSKLMSAIKKDLSKKYGPKKDC